MSLFSRNSVESFAKAFWYEFLRVLSRWTAVILFGMRSEGAEHIPSEGPAIVLSNHQSHFDPVLVGLSCPRRLHFLARSSLFRGGFAWLIRSLNAIPVERDGLGLGGLKETMRRLKNGNFVLVFPEGTRTPDGSVQPIKPGFSTLAKRAKVPLVPVGIAGAWEIWPKKAKLPKLFGVIHICYGPAIYPEEIEQMDQRELVAEVERRIHECHRRCVEARTKRIDQHSAQLVAAAESPGAS